MKHRTLAGLLILVILLLVGSQCLMVVPQGNSAAVLRFQRVVRSGLMPGLHFKLPFFDHPVYLSDDWIVLDGQRENGGLEKVTASDGQPMELGYILLWRISDVQAFCSRNPGCDQAQGAYYINQAALPLFKQAFAAHGFNEALSAVQDEVTAKLISSLNQQLQGSGMTVRSASVTSLELTDTTREIVYTHMRSAQSTEAAKLRADGKASADRIKADADQQRAKILAQSQLQAQKIRGTADAEASRIYAHASHQAPDFFRFFLGLQAYRRIMQDGNNVIVLGPDSQLLKYLKSAAKN